ncbi:MAG: DUF1574 family protein [Vampirovibrionales bacterium]|nr:DUF1574 family protein [Vampirovibrionales bacterium]
MSYPQTLNTPRQERPLLKFPGSPTISMGNKRVLFMPFVIGVILLVLLDVLIRLTPLDRFFNLQLGRDLLVKIEELSSPALADTDTVFIGTSRTLYGFATPYFNRLSKDMRAYNMGIAGSDVLIYRQILDNYIKHQGKPRRIFLELSEFELSKVSLSQNSINFLENEISQNPDLLWEMLADPSLRWVDKKNLFLSAYSRIYRYRATLDFRQLTKKILHPAPVDPIEQGWMKASKTRGYMGDPKTRSMAAVTRYQQLMKNRVPSKGASILRFLDYCKAQAIPVTVITWPLHPDYTAQIRKNWQTRLLSQRRQEVLQQYDARYIDLNQNVTMAQGDRFFTDIDHLNPQGARYFTRKLVENIN